MPTRVALTFAFTLLAQIAIIACDLAEVIGMAIGLQLLFHLPLIWGVSVTLTDTVLMLFLMNKGMRKLEAFIMSMIFIIGISFLIEIFIVGPDVMEIAKGFIPNNLFKQDAVSQKMLYIAIGIIGATVMPHNLYLHSSLVQTRQITRTPSGIRRAIKFNLFDTCIALNLAFVVNAAILILAAGAFFKNGYFQVAEIQDAYKLLGHIFGKIAPYPVCYCADRIGAKLYHYRDTRRSNYNGRAHKPADRALVAPVVNPFTGNSAGHIYHPVFWRTGPWQPDHIKPGCIEPATRFRGYTAHPFHIKPEEDG